jgi:type IV pilus assembly protein PilX
VIAAAVRERGAALVIGILLLLTLTILAVSGLETAVLEMRMAGNTQYQQRAFEAAEYAIEQALGSADLGTDYAYSTPKVVPASGAPPEVPGSPPDTYSYRLYYDASLGGTPLPGGGSPGPGLEAYHFVVEATGYSARGATDTHVQGFYLIGPAGSPASVHPRDCPAGAGNCTSRSGYDPQRTYWLQLGAD